MYSLLVSIVNLGVFEGDEFQLILLYTCASLICIFSAMTLDMIVRTIRAFIHKL